LKKAYGSLYMQTNSVQAKHDP